MGRISGITRKTVTTTWKIFFGKWNIVFPHMKFNLIFKPGKVTLNGRKIKVVPSKSRMVHFHLQDIDILHQKNENRIRNIQNEQKRKDCQRNRRETRKTRCHWKTHSEDFPW